MKYDDTTEKRRLDLLAQANGLIADLATAKQRMDAAVQALDKLETLSRNARFEYGRAYDALFEALSPATAAVSQAESRSSALAHLNQILKNSETVAADLQKARSEHGTATKAWKDKLRDLEKVTANLRSIVPPPVRLDAEDEAAQ